MIVDEKGRRQHTEELDGTAIASKEEEEAVQADVDNDALAMHNFFPTRSAGCIIPCRTQTIVPDYLQFVEAYGS